VSFLKQERKREPRPGGPMAELFDRLRYPGLEETIGPMLAECLVIAQGETEAGETVRSQFDGSPSLPPDLPWPKWQPAADRATDGKAGEGEKSLNFLCQIDLSEVPPCAGRELLPEAGMLFFFADAWGDLGFKDRLSWRVLFSEGDPTKSWPAPPPADLLPPDPRFMPLGANPGKWAKPGDPRSIGFFKALSLAANTPFAPGPNPIPVLGEEDRQSFALRLLADGLAQAEPDFGAMSRSEQEATCREILEKAHHQMLGHAAPLIPDFASECEAVISRPGNRDFYDRTEGEPAAQWVLLLQLDSDGKGERDRKSPWNWGDRGKLYFFIRRQDMAARRFDRAVLLVRAPDGSRRRARLPEQAAPAPAAAEGPEG
jgi:hypothetical protein